jgi:hypothetical protein
MPDLRRFVQERRFGHDKWCSFGVNQCHLKPLSFGCLGDKVDWCGKFNVCGDGFQRGGAGCWVFLTVLLVDVESIGLQFFFFFFLNMKII